jgi:tRNA(Phe) wybutosine-synthesizing methylase Tyw3
MFAQLKRESLRKLQAMEDKSPKGCIDEPIVDLIKTINAHPDYVGTGDFGEIGVYMGSNGVVAGDEQLVLGTHRRLLRRSCSEQFGGSRLGFDHQGWQMAHCGARDHHVRPIGSGTALARCPFQH